MTKQLFVITALFTLLALCAFGQTATAPAPLSTVQTAALPDITFGAGVNWNRGAVYPLVENTNLALHIKNTNWYSWTTVGTPVAPAPAGAAPLPSTISTGGAYIAAQSASGSVALVLILQGGLAATALATTGTFTGNLGVAFRIKKSNVFLMPFAGGSSSQGGNIGQFVLQPGVMVLYGFGGK